MANVNCKFRERVAFSSEEELPRTYEKQFDKIMLLALTWHGAILVIIARCG
jgi:hypothetical protein